MNKCHSNLNWLNDTTPAINDTNLNYMDGCIDTIDSRVVTMDSTKLEAGNIATVIKNVSVNDSTGVFTFTRYDNSTFTVDTMLEKVVTNFGFDETTQKLTITLEDGTTKQVDLSSFIKETEVADTDTVALSLVNHKLTATVKGNSIGDAQMQTQYLADCQSAKNTASSAATSSNTTRLQSEGYALGTQDSVPVGSDSIYYHNNAKWYKDQAQAIASSTLGGLSDVTITSPSEGQSLVYNADSQKWVNGDSAPTISVIDNLTSTSSTDALSANMGKTLNDSVSSIADDLLNVKMVGYTIPKECPIQNGIDNDGKFVQRVGRVDLGSLNWSYKSSSSYFYSSDIVNSIKYPPTNNDEFNGYCKEYTIGSAVASFNNMNIVCNTAGTISIKDSNYSDTTTFKSAISGTYLYYELATYQTLTIDGNETTLPKDWEFIGSVTGANSVTIDSTKYSEFYVCFFRNNDCLGSVFIVSSVLNSIYKYFKAGYYIASNNLGYGGLKATNSDITFTTASYDGTVVTSSTVMTVYGRR